MNTVTTKFRIKDVCVPGTLSPSRLETRLQKMLQQTSKTLKKPRIIYHIWIWLVILHKLKLWFSNVSYAFCKQLLQSLLHAWGTVSITFDYIVMLYVYMYMCSWNYSFGLYSQRYILLLVCGFLHSNTGEKHSEKLWCVALVGVPAPFADSIGTVDTLETEGEKCIRNWSSWV